LCKNTLAGANDHAHNFVWLSLVVTVAENQNFQTVAVELGFSAFLKMKENIFQHSTSVL